MAADRDVLGLIPARGGSKGIEKKNIVEVAGRPLIGYAIEALKDSESVDQIVCTTDNEEIAAVAREWGAEVPFIRPAEMARDDSPVFPALAHAARQAADLLDFRADYVVTAQPTYPLIQPNQIDAAVKMAVEQDAESVITAVELDHDAHPFNIRQQGSDGRASFWKEDEHYAHPNRQQKPTFYQFGNVFVSRYSLLTNGERLEGEDNYLVKVDRISTLDVNTPEDLEIVEYYLRKREDKDD